jgi:hypothetical protein
MQPSAHLGMKHIPVEGVKRDTRVAVVRKRRPQPVLGYWIQWMLSFRWQPSLPDDGGVIRNWLFELSEPIKTLRLVSGLVN